MANRTHLGLQAAVFTNDLTKAFWYADRIRSGTVVVNDSTDFWETFQPFGGAAGHGHRLGPAADRRVHRPSDRGVRAARRGAELSSLPHRHRHAGEATTESTEQNPGKQRRQHRYEDVHGR